MRLCLIVITYVFTFSFKALGGHPFEDLRKAERISSVLTGEPLPFELRTQFSEGKINLDVVIENLLSSEAFIRHYAKFWTPKLGINGTASLFDMQRATFNSEQSLTSSLRTYANGFLRIRNQNLEEFRVEFTSRRASQQPSFARLSTYRDQTLNRLSSKGNIPTTLNMISCKWDQSRNNWVRINGIKEWNPSLPKEKQPFNLLRFSPALTGGVSAKVREIQRFDYKKYIITPTVDSNGELVYTTNNEGLEVVVRERPELLDQDNVVPIYTELFNLTQLYIPECAETSFYTEVTDELYWAPENGPRWMMAKGLKDTNFCGTNHEQCLIQRNQNNLSLKGHLDAGSITDLNLEPGYIIGQVVADGLPFPEIFQTSKTVMSGRYALALRQIISLHDAAFEKTANYRSFWENFPHDPSEDPGLLKRGEFKETSSRWSSPDWNDTGLFWVERTNKHSGILSTYAFQTMNNGHRAKANRIFEAFTCSKFIVPSGILPDPSDANPDLRKRHYCSSCHRSLEPMAAFFNGWPRLGKTHYEFASYIGDENTRGIFDGKIANGLKGFGKLISENSNFASCAVSRTFEFITGRTWNSAERSILLDHLLAKYSAGNQNLKPVMRSIVKWMIESEVDK